ncbi:MAG: LysM peptidoglycan-binding domain-containing protein [Clostridiaceae bacterium]|nr:LysM peptidoglycan-binding domain-containing protein [Clostridiaceae bacterium]
MKKRYRLKNKRRFAAFLVIFISISVFTGMIVSAGASSRVKDEHEIIKVKSGDSLWEIALANSDNKDIREYIYDIKELNHLDSDVIYAGQILMLP